MVELADGRSDRGPDGRENRTPVDVEPVEDGSPDLDGLDTSSDPESMTLADIAEAEASRPTLSDETADGLDDMDEEIRHQAEDLPTDSRGRW